MASNSDNLYVTYVDVDRDLLKIWGQRNRMAATYIEKQLLQLLPEFNRAPTPNPAHIHKGMFCFAKYTDDNFYRARIISRVQTDSVGVLFVDYGNKDVIKLSNIRIQNGSEGDVLAKMAEQAEEYYLSGVIAPQPGWTKEIVSEIRRDICYEEFYYQIVSQVGDQKILEIQFRNEDFSSYLVRKQLAKPLSLPVQRQMILTYCSLVSNDMRHEVMRDVPRPNYSPSVPTPSLRVPVRPPNERVLQLNYEKSNRTNFSHPPPAVQYSSPRNMTAAFPHINTNVPKNSYFPPVNQPVNPVPISASSPQPIDPAFNPVVNNHFSPLQMVKEPQVPFHNNNNNTNIIQLLAQQVKQYIAEDNAKTESEAEKTPHHYVNSVLEVGSTYNVLISFIDDGPWSFSIQLLSSETELQKLMDELAATELVPIKPPIILGHPCIASSALYGNLCRGVVVSISHSAVKVYFVDFGNTEDLPSSSIYELPVKFFKIRVLSQKFSLNGLQKVAYSDDIKKFFKDVVQDELLMLRVTSLEDDNLPTCELYLKDKNIKRILNEKIRELRTSVDDFPKVGDSESVLVTWIVSPQKFFVQLHRRDADLEALKKELAEIETKGQKLTYQQLSVGFKCVCQYKNDGHWYRAVITSVDSENAITVFYVDYGNTEIVNISRLRRISSSSLINQMSNQAIQCTLKGFESKSFDEGVTNKLESLILEKELQMKIVSLEKELLCVQLFENGKDIASELLAATPPKLDLLDTSSMTRSDVLSCWDSPSADTAQEKEKKSVEVAESIDKTDIRGGRVEKNRHKNPSSRQMNKVQGFKSQNGPAPPRSKRRFEEDNWRNDKTKDNDWNEPHQNSKSRGPKQNEFMNDWNDQKPNGWKPNRDDWNEKGKSERNRAPREARNEFDRGKDNGEKKFNGEGKRFDRNKRRDDESKKKVDRNQRDRNIDDGKRNESSRKPVRKEDIVPPGSKYEERVIELKTCEKGIVTYYFSPHEFYVQLLTQEEEFRNMMKDIQIYYSDKYSLRDAVQAGDIVIAQFSLDRVLYRAEVVKPSPVTVRYVDYGNQEPAQAKGIWPLDKQFLKLPKQVLKCRLSNIQPIGSDWPPPGNGIDKFFESSEYKCTFLSFENDTYEISLEDTENGSDVASEIVAAGLASRPPPKLDVPEIDLDLLPKQVLRQYVSHVESPSKFHVVINKKGLEVIENEIRILSENKKNLLPLSEALIKPEMPCLTTNDGISWCRGKILKTDENNILVWFSDRGNTAEVTRDRVMILPDYLKVFQPQAVECFLHGASDVQDEEFKKAVENKHHLVSIVSVIGERLSVVLYNEDGQIFDFQKEPHLPRKVDPIGQLPIISQKLCSIISHLENPKEIYIQRLIDWDDIVNLSEELANFYGEREDFDLEEGEGELVAAKSVVYETWYRGRLVSSSDEGLEVFYVDYGNREILPRKNVKKLDSSFLNLNAFCRKIALDAEYDTNKTEDLKAKIFELCQDKELVTYFINNNGQFLCEFVLNNDRITPLLKSAGLCVNEPDNFSDLLTGKKALARAVLEQPLTDIPQNRSESTELKGFVSHVDTPKLFWVHKESTLSELQKFQDKLQKSCENLPDKENPQVNDIVAAVFSNTWYRAKVINVEENTVTTQFIDYGNTFEIDLGMSSVKELTDEFVKVPVFATPFALKGTWSADLTPKFEEIILRNEDPVTVVILEESDPPVINLFRNGQNFAEMLKEFKIGEEECEKTDLCTAYITYSRSPCDFYLQRESCTDVLNRLTERLLGAASFERPSTIKENEVYAAKFPEDRAWYRAKVTKCQGDEIEVHFIDFGNASKVSELRCLPNDIVGIPNLAERCCLLYGNNCDNWSEAACEKFAEFSDGRELEMEVVAVLPKRLLVDLFHEKVSIREDLEALCEKDERREVYVSYSHSPTDFYIQFVDDDQYKVIAEKLENGDEAEDLEERVPETICQARFADDGCWYRAKILQNLDGGCEVYFIDFGNVSTSNDLKTLPEEIKEIPPRALRCSLKLPQEKMSESVIEEFNNLTCNSATVFRARIIVPGEINIISLKMGGRILEETLCADAEEEAIDFSLSECLEGFPTSETDDGKNSKMDLITEDYLISDLGVDLTGGCVTNETDEEKRVKIAIIEAEGSDGFKSDDEKGIEGTSPSGLVNATDSELMEEVRDMTEWGNGSELSAEDSKDEGLENVAEVVEEEREGKMGSWEKADATSTEDTITATSQNGVSGHTTKANTNGSQDSEDLESVSFKKNCSRNKVHKIVPGCISRGEEEEENVSDTAEPVYQKIKYSDKICSGSVSRGVSLESMVNEYEPEESSEPQGSRSAPTTPKHSCGSDSPGYVKIDPNDRLVPGCISTGIPLHCSPAGEKIPAVEKIVSGAVNGSFRND